jgi:hypothetical protein
MSRRLVLADLGFDAFGTACGLAVVTGALALLSPRLDALTAALAALAVAGWASLHRRRPGPRSPRPGRYAAPLVLLGASAFVYLDPPPALSIGRALVLGLGLVPLWAAERGRPAPPEPVGA